MGIVGARGNAVNSNLKTINVLVAVVAALALGACKEDKTASKPGEPASASEKAAAALDTAKEWSVLSLPFPSLPFSSLCACVDSRD